MFKDKYAADAAQFESAKVDAEKDLSKASKKAAANAAYFESAKVDAGKKLSKAAKKAAKAAKAGFKPEKKPGALTRILADLGTAVWFGGSVFGILSLNPSVEVLDDPEERGKMVDEAWARFQPYGALGLGVATIAHFIMRARPPRYQTSTYKIAGLASDFFLVGSGVTSIAALALGEYAVDDHQPVDSATEPTGDTPKDTAKAQTGLSIASIAQLTCGVGLIIAAALVANERDKVR